MILWTIQSQLWFDSLKEKKILTSFRDENLAEYDENDKLLFERILTFDEKGNIIKQLTVNGKMKLVDVINFIYDEQGRVLEQSINKNYLIKFEYDDENSTSTETRIRDNGDIEYKCISKFNEDKYLYEEEHPQTTVKYEYEFYEE